MSRRLALLLLPMIAACGQESATTPDDPTTAAARVSGGDALSPGRWRVESQIAGMDGTQSEYLCITDQQAASGRFLLGELPEGCAIERDSMAGGRIDFALRCGELGSTFAGTYGTTSYRTRTTINLGAGEPMRATSSGTFIGSECQPNDQRLSVE